MGAFRLRRLLSPGQPPAPPVGSGASTLRSTDTQLVDLASALASVPDSTRVTLSVTGSVSAQVWPYVTSLQGTGAAVSWPKRNLVRNLAAVTSAASTGASVGTWTFTAPGFSYTHIFSVDDAAPTAWDYGQNTLAQYGGYPIAQYLPGTPSDWAIQSQSTSGAFTLNTTTNCVAFAGTAGSQTRTVGTPALGAAAYTVTLANAMLGQTHTISFNVLANRWDCAADDNTQIVATLGKVSAYGDEVWLNDTPAGTYQNPTRTNGLTFAACPARAQRSGGPAQPQGPYASDSWEPQDARNAGWITVRPRTPWGVRLNRISATPPTGGAGYIRWYLLDNRASTSPPVGAVEMSHKSNLTSWQMHDSCISSDITVGGNASISRSAFFAIDNWAGQTAPYPTGSSSQTNGIQILATDSQIVGNMIEGVGNDAIIWWLADTVAGSGKSKLWWNYITNKKYPATGSHGDFCQNYGTTANISYALVQSIADSYRRLSVASELGNVFVRGQGQVGDGSSVQGGATDAGKDVQDGQGSWCGDWNAQVGEYTAKSSVAGMIYVGTFLGGIGRKWFGPGTALRNNAIIWPQYLTNAATDLGMSAPGIRILGAGGKLSIADNVIGDGSTGGIRLETNDTVAPPTPVTSNNVSIGGTDNTAHFANPNAGLASAKFLHEVIDALTPKAGGPLTVAGGASQVVGAVGTGLIDHINRTYDASVLQPLAGAPTTQAQWSDTATPSGATTVGSTLTAANFAWNDTVTVLTRSWLRNGSTISGATGSTYVLQAADSGASVQYVERVTDSQGNVVAALSAGVAIS